MGSACRENGAPVTTAPTGPRTASARAGQTSRRAPQTTTMATCCGLRGTCRPGPGSRSQATPEGTSQAGSRHREPRPRATRRTARQSAAARPGTESRSLAGGIGRQTGGGCRRPLTPCTGRRRQARRAEREARGRDPARERDPARDRDPARIRSAAAGAGRRGRRHLVGLLRAPSGVRRRSGEFLVLPVPLGLLSSWGPTGRLGLWGLGLWGLGLRGLGRAPTRAGAGGGWGPRRQLGTAMVPVLPRRAGPRDQ